MRVTNQINAILHPLMFKYLRHQYVKKLNINKRKHPDVFARPDTDVIKKHIALWKPLIFNVNTAWIDMFYGISGNADYQFVPEDVFYGVIERCLNNCNASGSFVEDKNDVCFYIPKQYQPMCIARYDRGVWFDGDFNPLNREQAAEKIRRRGGSNVRVWAPKDVDLRHIESTFEGYLFQEILKQEHQVAAFNQSSINTCRIMTFRRPWSGETSAIAGMLRLGCGEGIADNLALGGVSVDIDKDGKLSDYGVDHDFGKYTEHPTSKIAFKGFTVPYYADMCKVACEVAKKVPGYNLLSFDMIARPEGTPCIIEINATSMTLAQLQTVRPLFGGETEEVMHWCAAHRSLDVFKHFRTWY